MSHGVRESNARQDDSFAAAASDEKSGPAITDHGNLVDTPTDVLAFPKRIRRGSYCVTQDPPQSLRLPQWVELS